MSVQIESIPIEKFNLSLMAMRIINMTRILQVDRASEKESRYFEFISEVVQAETASTRQRRVQNLVKNSRLPQPLKMISDFDFDFQPTLDRRLIMDLASLEFMERNSSVLLQGSNGTGKSHLGQSLALLACQQECKTYYTTLSGLITDLNTGVYEKTLEKRIRKYINPELLVIDEMGHDWSYKWSRRLTCCSR